MDKKETANQITQNILKVVNYQPGCCAARVNTMGVFDKETGRWKKTAATNGVEDIICVIRGRYVGVEVKAGRDTQSDSQKIRQFEVERAKGIYFIARSTDHFLEFFTRILELYK